MIVGIVIVIVIDSLLFLFFEIERELFRAEDVQRFELVSNKLVFDLGHLFAILIFFVLVLWRVCAAELLLKILSRLLLIAVISASIIVFFLLDKFYLWRLKGIVADSNSVILGLDELRALLQLAIQV